MKYDIDKRLQQAYSSEDRKAFALGGSPGLKEILLYTLIRRMRPKFVVETGVAQGVSTSFVLQALEDNGAGSLVSIDLPNFSPEGFRYRLDPVIIDRTYVKQELGVGWLVPPSLRHRWTLRVGSSADELPRLGDSQVDLFFHDSEHSYGNMTNEFHWAVNHLRPGGLLVSDDVTCNSAFDDLVNEYQPSLRVIVRSPVGVCQTILPCPR